MKRGNHAEIVEICLTGGRLFAVGAQRGIARGGTSYAAPDRAAAAAQPATTRPHAIEEGLDRAPG